MLQPKGIFILDYLNAFKVRKNLVAEEEELFRDMTVHIERKIENNMVYKKIRFTGKKLEEPIHYQERVKLYEKG
ncbi:SAM-dependent methyltransferase, partial [Candidatus Saccharibacteria bacterium]|nr:SAM-dependent methyltransferase [Calditrichia bacterium]NIV99754.1 SAM-dependent methyltransferase [Candidatus Saccharibacteria bacterium]NIW79656.1 SAM-dependent methyltransferase [Calditrichia bacterium]